MKLDKKTRGKIDYLLFELKDEYERIDVDVNFCKRISSLIEEIFFQEERKTKNWFELHGIHITRKAKCQSKNN